MDAFYEGAIQMKFKQMLLVGAAFGVFLTNANAWSDLLKNSVNSVIPEKDNTILHSAVNAIILSFISIPALCLLFKLNIFLECIYTKKRNQVKIRPLNSNRVKL